MSHINVAQINLKLEIKLNIFSAVWLMTKKYKKFLSKKIKNSIILD